MPALSILEPRTFVPLKNVTVPVASVGFSVAVSVNLAPRLSDDVDGTSIIAAVVEPVTVTTTALEVLAP